LTASGTVIASGPATGLTVEPSVVERGADVTIARCRVEI
jgi:hypothetical protein